MARYLIGNVKGPAGEDGFSPVARVEQTSTGATITVTDANGTTTANIRNGIDGDGSPIDLSEYATKVEVAALAADIEAQDYATETYVDDAVAGVTIPVTSVNGMVGNVTIDVPTKTSDLTNDSDFVNQTALAAKQDVLTAGTGISIENNVISATSSGGITTETDPVFSASPAATITSEDIADWDAKSEFSGSYNDLTNKPDLSVYATQTALTNGLADKQDTLTAGTNISIDNNVISATDTTYTAGTGIDITNGVISAIGGGSGGDSIVHLTNWISASDWEPIGLKIKEAIDDGYNGSLLPKIIESKSYLFRLGSITEFYQGGGVNLNVVYSNDNSYPINRYSNSKSPIDLGKLFVCFNVSKADGSINSFYRPYGSGVVLTSDRIDTGLTYSNDWLQVDTTTIATKTYVDNAVAGAGGGGTTYTAGTGIDITNDEISIDNTVVATLNDIPANELPSIGSGDAGKVLTVNSGETGVEWAAAASGGSSYTAGRGISIDANDKITSYPLDTTTGLLLSLLGKTNTESTFNGNTISLYNGSTKDAFINGIKNGKVISLGFINYWNGLGTDLYNLGFTNILTIADNGTLTSIDLSASNQSSWKPTRYWSYWACSNIIIGVQSDNNDVFGKGIINNLYYNNATSGLSSSTIKGAIDELASGKQDALPALTNNAGKVLTVNSGATGLEWTTPASGGSSLPADPAADGTYFLTTTVSSGTATQSWVTIPTANGNNF